jgi:hypothetical protein
VQSYFNYRKIEELFGASLFTFLECFLIRRENVGQGGFISRYHLTLEKE